MRRLSNIPIFLLSSILSLSFAQSDHEKELITWITEVLEGPEKHLENYQFNPESDILSRVKEPSDSFMKYMQKSDNKDYTAYIPFDNDMKIIEESINLLPPLHKKNLKRESHRNMFHQ